MKPVFISYSSRDRDFVNRLLADLQANGVNVWIAQTGLKAGTRDWEQALRDAIRGAQAIVLVASPNSRQSTPVKGELAIAEMYKCPVVPVWASGDEWPDSIVLDRIPMQYIDARDEAYAAAIPQLVEALGQVPVVAERPKPVVVTPDFEPRNPYKGLRAFREEDAGDFFGREALIDELVEALRERLDNNRLLAVIGPSGSGKSSIVMAGLLPRLRAGVLPDSGDWVYLNPMVPGVRPLESLSITLSNALSRANMVIRQDLDDPEERGLHVLGRQIVGQTDNKLLLLIDQFEELFTQTINDDERRQFIALLVAAVSEPKGPVTVILTLRADFYDWPMQYPALYDLLQPHLPVPPMSIDNLRNVIEKPADLPDVKVQFEEGLVGDLLFEVRERVGGLPLLQFTLDQLFEQRDKHTLTMEAYREIGGLRGALARHAEATYAELDTDDHRTLARTLFLRLIEPGATEQDTTRRRADMAELELEDATQTERLHEVADAFVTARLLTTGEMAGKATIEVSHEALIREWERLGHWLEAARDDIVIQQDVSGDAAAWIERGQQPDDDLLYRGTVLAERLDWAARNVPNKDEQAFLEASVALEERLAEADRKRREREAETARQAQQYERRARQFRRWAVILFIVFVAALVATLIAMVTAQNAQKDLKNAQTQQVIAETQVADNQGTRASVEEYALEYRRTVEWEATYVALEQGRAATLAAGGVILPAVGSTQVPADIISTLTQVATLNNREPVVEDDGYGVEMVQVPAGCFWMGSMFRLDEQPVHEVCFDEPFWIDRYEITNEQFERLKGVAAADSTWSNPNQPRTNITWFEAYEFCQQREAQLPSEAQWEYAARSPDSLIYPWGNDFVADNVVYNANAEEPVDVGEDQRPEGVSWVGAYDLSGNVWEWVADWYAGDYYATFANVVVVGPPGPEDGNDRVLRGGSWGSDVSFLRAAFRNFIAPDIIYLNGGFRCARLD